LANLYGQVPRPLPVTNLKGKDMPQDQRPSRSLRYTTEPVYQDFSQIESSEIVPSTMEREVVMNLRVNFRDIEQRMLAHYYNQYPSISRVWADEIGVIAHSVDAMRYSTLTIVAPEPPAFELDI
jgi:hypothetical protein